LYSEVKIRINVWRERMKCESHETEMDWIEVDDPLCFPDGGYWNCDQCVAEEEKFLEGQNNVAGEPDWGPWDDPEEDENRFCPHCGKEYEDFSDYGCEYCDRRVL
jgi:hypothetical protein